MISRILALALIAALELPAEAEPLRLLFQATVTDAGDFSSTALPFALEPGDVLNGELVFGSLEDVRKLFEGPDRPSVNLSLGFQGFEMSNVLNLGSLQPIADLNNPPSGPRSGVSLGWTPPTNVFPAFSGTYDSNATIGLAGPEGLMESIDDVVDFDKWNALTTSRVLSLSFGYPDPVSVDAAIGPITVVPEPTSVVLAFALLPFLRARRILSTSQRIDGN